MKIFQITSADDWIDEDDFRQAVAYVAKEDDGKLIKKMVFVDGEPEDANLGRDFSGVWSIGAFFELIQDRLAAGEKIDTEYVELDNWHEQIGEYTK